MIKAITILFLSLLSLTAFSQSGGFVPVSDAHWSLQREDGFGGYNYSYYRIPETQYDTIIGSNHYSKIYNIPGIIQPESYLGACRGDSSGKVFFVLKGASDEHLLMDFGALTGDTVYDVIYMGDTVQKVDFAVDSIGNITAGSRLHKCIFLSNKTVFPDELGFGPKSLVWVELFGCLNGGIFNYIGCTGFSPQWITCMFYKDSVYSNFSDCVNFYPLDNISVSTGSCVYPLSIEEQNLRIEFYPNPASDVINCVLPDNGDYDIVVYDAISSVVTLSGVEMSTTEGQVRTLNISHLPSGIYFIEARGERVLRGKFVKE